MPTITRRRDPDARQETEKWLIFYGDVQAGSIMRAVGNPGAAPLWQWHCGFYPGSKPGECSMGTAPTFDQARTAFEAAWRGHAETAGMVGSIFDKLKSRCEFLTLGVAAKKIELDQALALSARLWDEISQKGRYQWPPSSCC